MVDAYGDDEQLWAFRQAFEDDVRVPCEGYLLREPVVILKFDYDGNERRGLTAKCRRADGSQHVVAAWEVEMPPDTEGARYLAAYRRWLGLPRSRTARAAGATRSKSNLPVEDLSRPVELVILSVKQRAARCRTLDSDQVITLRAGRLWDLVPGEIATIRPGKQWSYAGHPYLSGEIRATRIDASALGLTPLAIKRQDLWDPDRHYWGEEGAPIEPWAKPIMARGQRPQFEMEQVLPGADTADPFSDPLCEANDRKDGGDIESAHKILMNLCDADLRCLDAHAHLGNLIFDRWPKEAIRHFEVGYRIGEWSLGGAFDGLLPWGWINNRPFLRCMHGYGLCLWRLGRFEEAVRIFDRMLWLNPYDNQGVRFLIEDVRGGDAWENCKDN